MFGDLNRAHAYTFARVNAPALDPYKPHPNSWAMTRDLFWYAGGYDEALAGNYGTDGDFKVRVNRVAAIVPLEVPLGAVTRAMGDVHPLGNPHYWLDPENARPITERIRGALVGLSPGDAALFEANRARFLRMLDAGLTRWGATLAPYHGTRVVVAHESWPYFARRVGLTVVAALEPTPGVPPSAAYLAALTGRMKASGVRVIIAEPSTSASLVAQVAARAEARAVILIPSVGGDPAARDYLSLFDVNVARLAAALAAAPAAR